MLYYKIKKHLITLIEQFLYIQLIVPNVFESIPCDRKTCCRTIHMVIEKIQ